MRQMQMCRFNSQPPEGGWLTRNARILIVFRFQLTAARRRLASAFEIIRHGFCFNSQPPEGGWRGARSAGKRRYVSTHSRPKAAGCPSTPLRRDSGRFNSQPPEGGWPKPKKENYCYDRFNSQPPEGGWLTIRNMFIIGIWFQLTAARRRLGLAFL